MASTINASSAGIIETADNTGVLQLQTNGLQAVNIDSSQNVTVPGNLTVNGTLTAPGITGVTNFSAGSTGLTPSTATTGPVSLAGTLNVAHGGTGTTNLTSGGFLVGNGTGAVTSLVGGTNGYIPVWNSTSSTWVPTSPGSSSLVIKQEYQTATQGQTAFTIATFTYTTGTNALSVYVNGSKQVNTLNYTETSTSVVTFSTGLNAGDIVEFIFI
jgi:hypothetical protein